MQRRRTFRWPIQTAVERRRMIWVLRLHNGLHMDAKMRQYSRDSLLENLPPKHVKSLTNFRSFWKWLNKNAFQNHMNDIQLISYLDVVREVTIVFHMNQVHSAISCTMQKQNFKAVASVSAIFDRILFYLPVNI